MRTPRKTLLRLIAWLALCFAALRPTPEIERAFAVAAAPLRLLAEGVAPLLRLRGGEVRAREARFFRRGAEDLTEVEGLWRDLFAAARPRRPDLLAGRHPVPGEVIGRAPGDKDRLRVRVASTAGVERGMPAVHGDTYVGRVERVVDEGELEVELVTSARFSVGARLAPHDARREPVWMTVGGVPAARRFRGLERLALAVRNPADREPPPGLVEVHELLPDVDPWGELARGYRLGELVAGEGGELAVQADVDYNAGLFHVFVLRPADPAAGPEQELELALADARWRPARQLVGASPTPWREGLVASAGLAHGVRPGAAVIAGLRLVGRVDSASPWSADVRALADPGLALPAVARVEGDAAPRVLGRLVSLGRLADDPAWIELLWEAIVEVDLPAQRGPDGLVRAELFSGSGELGLPGGLYLGEALLDDGAEPRVYLRDAGALALVERLWVRTEEGP